MNRILFLGLSLCLLVQNALAAQTVNRNAKNQSQLTIDNSSDEIDGATFCKGKVDAKTQTMLTAMGVSPQILGKKAYCTVGDFDGNGSLDFAIWGNNLPQKKIPDYQNFAVLFFDKGQVIRTAKIVAKVEGSLLLHYAPRKSAGPHGEPVCANDALWFMGQTNDYDDASKGVVYVYDANAKAFKEVTFGRKGKR